MTRKKGVRRMSPTSITQLSEHRKRKQERDYTQVIPIKKLTREQMISTAKKRRREE